MEGLESRDIALMFLALGLLLAVARVLGELASWLNQPAVLGEMLAGVVLGKTVLGRVAPDAFQVLFPSEGAAGAVLVGLTTLAIALFLVVAGMEVDLSTIWRQGRVATTVGLAGIVLPFGIGLGAAWWAPRWVGYEPGADLTVFALFFATALSISALPVIAKTLMDLNLYRSDMGMIVIAAAVFNDLVGWIIFAVLLGMLGTTGGNGPDIGMTITLTLLFTAVTLTIGRWAVHRALPWIQAHTIWPGGVLGFALSLALFGAAFTEWIGVHAIFGSFLVGVAVGDSSHLREQTRIIILQFVSFFFAPLFFASIGLSVDFAANFDLQLIVIVTVLACMGKVLGCGLGGRWSGLGKREAWAVGFGLNARGGMVIILSLLALQSGLIGERMFVGLVMMALITSVMSGPVMARLLQLKKPRRLASYMSPKTFINPLQAGTRREAIHELTRAACTPAGLKCEEVEAAVLAREQLMSTGLGNSLAVPHARIEGLTAPVLGVGLSEAGVDFDAPDGELAQIIFLILTPWDDNGAQIEILADIARSFRDEEHRKRALRVKSYTEFLALLKTELH
ncbi:MAG: hypothetical protein AMXMBFR13_31640 [Phycisphaerae bacterium]